MIAVAILAIALPILLGLRNTDVAMRQEAKAITTAVLLAQEKLFETELLGFPEVGEIRGDFTTTAPGAPLTAEIKDRAPGFRWVRLVGSTPFEQIREVHVRVTWPGGGSERAVDITNYVFKEPVRQPGPAGLPGAS
jgi:general secretion pathway protein I